MAMLGSTAPIDVGLRLLLSPMGSNVVIRTACCSVGVVLPVYSTFKAIESRNPDEQHKWLLYWAAYGSFSVAEAFTDKIISWFPLYYHMKFAFLVWLQLPTTEGAKTLYMNHLRPFLLRHQARLDQISGFLYGEMGKFLSAHQSEIQVAKRILVKIFVTASDFIHPTERQRSGRAIEGRRRIQEENRQAGECPTTPLQNSESDTDE